MIDPLIHIAMRGLISVILGVALFHKLRDYPRFRSAVAAYKIVPASFTQAAAVAVMFCEFLALAILVAGDPTIAGTAAALLFALYGGVIAINIARGRTSIDCGCSWVKGAALSPLYAYRNAVLVAISAMLVIPTSSRALVWFDYVNALLFAVVAAGTYFLLDGLLHMKHLGEVQ